MVNRTIEDLQKYLTFPPEPVGGWRTEPLTKKEKDEYKRQRNEDAKRMMICYAQMVMEAKQQE